MRVGRNSVGIRIGHAHSVPVIFGSRPRTADGRPPFPPSMGCLRIRPPMLVRRGGNPQPRADRSGIPHIPRMRVRKKVRFSAFREFTFRNRNVRSFLPIFIIGAQERGCQARSSLSHFLHFLNAKAPPLIAFGTLMDTSWRRLIFSTKLFPASAPIKTVQQRRNARLWHFAARLTL